MGLADAYGFAVGITAREPDEPLAGTPPPRPVRRIAVVRPEELPTVYIRKLEEFINADPHATRTPIPGTRIYER